MMSCGLATHYSLSERLPLVEEQLGKLMTDDPSVIGNCLAKFEDVVHLDQMSVFQRIEILNKCFSNETMEEIIDSLDENLTSRDPETEFLSVKVKQPKQQMPGAFQH
ncbi:hypothetical protein AABB24_017173 [Solanum stoloniferum]|uniref:3-hydroxyisobutyryl-CoA hydrolase n=1 Tax=Solanum stoloniferum TaxID=62892 RepID=A0ABD2TJA3_9SOLN